MPPLHAPTTPSLAELNTQALEGNMDACRALAARSSTCKHAWEFVDLFVPTEDLKRMVAVQADGWPLTVFDLYCDAFVWSRTPGAKRDTVELPAVGTP
jgi:hypothetical protein